MPSDYSVVDLPFFQKCLMGLLEMAAPVDYDVLVCTVSPDDMSQLERIVENHKVDGVVLGRTLVNDAPAEYLKEKRYHLLWLEVWMMTMLSRLIMITEVHAVSLHLYCLPKE